MPFTNAFQIAGDTVGLSVGTSSHSAITVSTTNSAANALLVVNTSTSAMIYANIASSQIEGSTPPTAAAAAVPGDGTKGSAPVLSYGERVFSCLRFPVSVTAISDVTGPTKVTVTPIILL